MSDSERTARLPGTGPRMRRGAVIAGAVVIAGGVATGVNQAAFAQPQPSVSQVQAKVNSLTATYDKAQEQYDSSAQQLSQARSRLAQVNKEVAADTRQYDTSKAKVVQIANAAYEDSGQTSLAGLITTGDPTKVLNEASMILQIAGDRNYETRAFLTDAQQLQSVQESQKRTEQGIAQLAAQREKVKTQAQDALNSEKAQLDSLTQDQQQQVQQNSLGGTASGAITAVTGSGNAAKAVAFDLQMAQDSCPYVYGATGPCSAGFDCSGLQQAAWAAAGVSIPRDTYEQWASLPHVSMSDLQPGDLIYYDGEGHVAMYVGNGMIVDAPQTGEDVREIPENESWYASNEDGAVRP